MQGGAEQYLGAYALFLHASPFQAGLLGAVPHFVGIFAQLLCVQTLSRFNYRKAILVITAASQSLLWLPMLALAVLVSGQGAWLLLGCTVLYFV